MKLYWHYKYVNEQRQILPNDIIETTPDKFGRWQLCLKIFVDPIILNVDNLFENEYPLNAAIITYNDTINMFSCNCLNVENNGISFSCLSSKDARLLMIEVETTLTTSINILNHILD